jgi:predicted GNAT family acetyltransferase
MIISFTSEIDRVPPSVDQFLANSLERNVLASLLVHARAGRMAGSTPLFAWETSDEQVRFFAMRTPPWPLLVSELSSADAESFVRQWIAIDPALPGVSGVTESTRAVASSWQRQTAGRSSCRTREAMHVLVEVIDPPTPPPGALRPARAEDRELLIDWERAFVADADLIPGAAEEAERTVSRRLAAGAQYLWDHDGPASTLALSPEIAGTVRIGPVYTPPERRRRGYASAAVARASRDALARGARQCMLITDLANPTSNKIYAAVGFRRCGDWEEHSFSAAAAGQP